MQTRTCDICGVIDLVSEGRACSIVIVTRAKGLAKEGMPISTEHVFDICYKCAEKQLEQLASNKEKQLAYMISWNNADPQKYPCSDVSKCPFKDRE